jgi:hypothetical protein
LKFFLFSTVIIRVNMDPLPTNPLRGFDERRPLMTTSLLSTTPSSTNTQSSSSLSNPTTTHPTTTTTNNPTTLNRESTSNGSATSLEIVQMPLNGGETAINGATAVRRNILRDTWADAMSTTRRGASFRMTLLYTIITIPQIVASWILLALYGNVESCPKSVERDVSINVWIGLDSLQLVMAIFLAWQVHRALRAHELSTTTEAGTEIPPSAEAERRLRYWRIASFWNDLFGVLWLVKGSGVFFGEVSCDSTAPHLFPLGQALMFIAVGILALPIVACVFIALAVCFCLPCLVRAVIAVHGSSRRVKGVTAEVLDRIPIVTYTSDMFTSNGTPRHNSGGNNNNNNNEDPPQCAICLANYVVGDKLRMLQCDARHHFHQSCCDDWLKLNASCPVCRRPVGGGGNDTTNTTTSGGGGGDGAGAGAMGDVENPVIRNTVTTTTSAINPTTTTTSTNNNNRSDDSTMGLTMV